MLVTPSRCTPPKPAQCLGLEKEKKRRELGAWQTRKRDSKMKPRKGVKKKIKEGSRNLNLRYRNSAFLITTPGASFSLIYPVKEYLEPSSSSSFLRLFSLLSSPSLGNLNSNLNSWSLKYITLQTLPSSPSPSFPFSLLHPFIFPPSIFAWLSPFLPLLIPSSWFLSTVFISSISSFPSSFLPPFVIHLSFPPP